MLSVVVSRLLSEEVVEFLSRHHRCFIMFWKSYFLTWVFFSVVENFKSIRGAMEHGPKITIVRL